MAMDTTDAGLYTERNPDLPAKEYYNKKDKSNHRYELPMAVDPDDYCYEYNMNHKKRGVALIINNEVFEPSTGMSKRNGSSKDVESIKAALINLGFDVIERKNQTVKETRQLFEDISEMDHTNFDCFLCVILSHGKDNDVIYGTDDTIYLNEIIAYMLPDKCKDLLGKPKLFFIQACRGTKLDRGVQQHDARVTFDHKETSQNIPLWADLLIAYSTVPGFYSWRNAVTGSWFIQSLSYVLDTYGDRLEQQQMLIKMNYRIAYEYEAETQYRNLNKMKQVPCIASMLTKQVYFREK